MALLQAPPPDEHHAAGLHEEQHAHRPGRGRRRTGAGAPPRQPASHLWSCAHDIVHLSQDVERPDEGVTDFMLGGGDDDDEPANVRAPRARIVERS